MKFDLVTKEHIIQGVKDFEDKGFPNGFKQSNTYDVIIKDKPYPPPAIMAYAYFHAEGKNIDPGFRVGQGSECFEVYEKLGFEIKLKKENRIKTEMNLKELFINTLNYDPNNLGKFPGDGRLKSNIEGDIPTLIKKILSEDQLLQYSVEGSIGKGLWAIIPWVAILNSSITNSVSTGYYIVYLFSLTEKKVFLTLNQGTGGIKEAKSGVDQNEIRQKIISDITVDLGDFIQGKLPRKSLDVKGRKRPKAYEDACVLWKSYNLETLISIDESKLEGDLLKMIDIYDASKEIIENTLEDTDRSAYSEINDIDLENYVFEINSNTIKDRLITLSKNQIFYGPPGTGKTFFLKEQLFEKYTLKEESISKEKYFEEVITSLTWWQVITLALIENGKSKVSDILNNRWVATKASLSESKNVRATIWGTLQIHTIEESTSVNYKQRQAPLIFDKTQDKSWELLEVELKEQAPEIYKIKDEVDNFQVNAAKSIKHYDFVTFHQSFSYEDFIEGIKPIFPENDEEASDLGYTIEDGVFKRLCLRAKNDPENRYAIFIDEINRGNVSAIFGELITLIETDKRSGAKNEMSIKLPYSKKEFSVPSNLDIYGTMNTADRSVEALDTALRRRFEFVEKMPDYKVIDHEEVNGVKLSKVLKVINKRIELLIDRDHTIGHSYFVGVDTSEKLANAFNNKIVPLLQEYFYGDYGKIGLVLGNGFVKEKDNRKLKFSTFKYEGKEDFITPTYKLIKVDESTVLNAVEQLLETNES